MFCLKECACHLASIETHANVRRLWHCFIALSISCWSILSIRRKRFACLSSWSETACLQNIIIKSLHKTFNPSRQNQITISRSIRSRTFTQSFIKFVQKPWKRCIVTRGRDGIFWPVIYYKFNGGSLLKEFKNRSTFSEVRGRKVDWLTRPCMCTCTDALPVERWTPQRSDIWRAPTLL